MRSAPAPARRRNVNVIALAVVMLLVAITAIVLLAGGSPRRGSPAPAAPGVGSQAAGPVPRYPFVYVAIGASDSYGVGVDDPATESWPAVLASYLPRGAHFVNLGVPGIMLHRAIQAELPVALDARPSLVTVWLAVNDLASAVPLPRYQHDLDALLGALQRRTRARVLIANIPDLTLLPSFANRAGVGPTVAAWNAAIAAAARAHGATLVDLYRGWRELAQHPEYVGPDGLHPSAAGYRRLAQLFWQAYS